MYSIRVRPGSATLDIAFSGEVPAAEALRAVSQGFALAEAGSIQRALCDVRSVAAGPDLDALPMIAASLVTRLAAGERVAVLCLQEQLSVARRFARFARIGEELAVFTRLVDADEWLAAVPQQRLSPTALRHLAATASETARPRDSGARPANLQVG